MEIVSRWVMLLTLLACGANSQDLPAAEVRIRPEFICRKPVVTVGDLLDLKNLRSDKAESIGKIELFAAPAERKDRLVRVAELRELLTLHDVDLGDWQLQGPDQIRVRSQRESKGLAPASGVAPQSGQQFAEGTQRAIFVKRSIAQGVILRAEDIQVQPLPDSARALNYVSAPEDVVGYQALRPLVVGQPIQASFLKRPMLVTKNSTVAVVSRSGGVQVRSSAKALESGGADDVVTVETLGKSREKLEARVVGRDQVEIYAGVPVVTATR